AITAHVFGQAPTRLVGGAPEGHASQTYYLEAALLQHPHFVGLLEALQHHVETFHHSSCCSVGRTHMPSTATRHRQLTLWMIYPGLSRHSTCASARPGA